MPVFEGKVTVVNKYYLENIISRRVLRLTQPLLLWESGAISLGVNQRGRGTDHFTLVPRLRYVEQYLNSLIYNVKIKYRVEIKYRDSCGFWIITINRGEL
jgi:hypothetical protein